MGIKTKSEASKKVIAMMTILDVLQVSGRKNCAIVAAIGNDLGALKAFLDKHDADDEMLSAGEETNR